MSCTLHHVEKASNYKVEKTTICAEGKNQMIESERETDTGASCSQALSLPQFKLMHPFLSFIKYSYSPSKTLHFFSLEIIKVGFLPYTNPKSFN
jgi:hypothetical protein